jgi:RNA polymerase sigma factor (sigma-70 family)
VDRPDERPRRLDPADEEAVRRAIRRAVGKVRLRRQDRDDLSQDLWARALRALRAFDPGRGTLDALVSVVVRHGVSTYFRDQLAARRYGRGTVSLNRVTLRDGEAVELEQTVGAHEFDARRLYHPPGEAEQRERALDLEEALARLPSPYRELAEELKTKSLAEVAREQGVARSTLQGRVRKLLRLLGDLGVRSFL